MEVSTGSLSFTVARGLSQASLYALILAISIAASAQANDQHIAGDAEARTVGKLGACEENAATGYLKLIEAMDWEAMHQQLAEHARYLDPTMVHYDRPAIDLTGPDAIVSFWRSSSEESGTSNIRYHYTHCFETAGFYVVRYEIEVEVSGQFWGLEQERITVPGQVTSVIQMADGQITEHRDYVDYAGADRYIEALKQRNER